MDARRQGKQSSSPEARRDRSYSDYDKYDSRRADPGLFVRDSRYSEDTRRSDSADRQVPQVQYRNDDQFDRQSWDRDDRRDSYVADRSQGSGRLKDDYLIVDVRRETTTKIPRRSAQYSDSDEECLHESLRRKKQSSQPYSDDEDQCRWSTEDDYPDYRQLGKRTLSGDSYRSPSPPPAKVRRERYSSEDDHQNARSYSDYGNDSDRGRHAPEPPPKKKKVKGSKKNGKGKDKKRKASSVQNSVLAPSMKIQSLMDVEIPTSVKKQIEQTTTPSLPRFGESRSEFKFGQQGEETGGRSLPRGHDEERGRSRYDDSSRARSRYDDDHYIDRPRDSSAIGRRDSESDRKGHHAHKDVYCSRRSPEYERRTYHHSDDDFAHDHDRDRHHRASFSRDNRNSTDLLLGAKRKRQSSVERRDWQRSGNRNNQKDRSPDFRAYSDSDQDSEREGGRRSWRDERRERQPRKKDDERDKNQKGDKKSKSKQANSKDTKKSSVAKKEKHLDQEAR